MVWFDSILVYNLSFSFLFNFSWWGRGVIQTSGICNFGKLNYYLGKRAFLEGRDSRYPDIDFCKDPEIICTSEENKELKWIAGFFYWVDQVQPYESDGWNYLTELKKFVHNGMVGEEFINAVSGIVNRGCHNPVSATLSMFYLLILANQSLLTMQIPCLCFSALRYRRPRWRSGTCGKFFHHPQGT